jgi:hypothetical protein
MEHNPKDTGITPVIIMSPIVVLYPRGGAFNKLRSEQTLLETLLKDCLYGYGHLKSSATEKKNYVKKYILDHLDDRGHAFMIFDGDHPERGKLVKPGESEAYKKIMQKLRSMKKERHGTVSSPVQSMANTPEGSWCQDSIGCTCETYCRFFTISLRFY